MAGSDVGLMQPLSRDQVYMTNISRDNSFIFQLISLLAKQASNNVYPCVPKNPVCRKTLWFRSIKFPPRKYIKL
jgi:hypothetical protein